MGKHRKNQDRTKRDQKPQPAGPATAYAFDPTKKSVVDDPLHRIERELSLDRPGQAVAQKAIPIQVAQNDTLPRRGASEAHILEGRSPRPFVNLTEEHLREQYPNEVDRLVAVLYSDWTDPSIPWGQLSHEAKVKDHENAFDRLFALRDPKAAVALIERQYRRLKTLREQEIADWCFAEMTRAPTAEMCVAMIKAGWKREEARALLNRLYDPLADDSTGDRPPERRFADALYAVQNSISLQDLMNPKSRGITREVRAWCFAEIERAPTFEACMALIDHNWHPDEAADLAKDIDASRLVEALVPRMRNARSGQDEWRFAALLDHLRLPESAESILRDRLRFKQPTLLWAVDQLRAQQNSAALFAGIDDGRFMNLDRDRQACANALVELNGLGMVVKAILAHETWASVKESRDPELHSPMWETRRNAASSIGSGPAILSLIDNDIGHCRSWAVEALSSNQLGTRDLAIFFADSRPWWRQAAVTVADTSDPNAVELLAAGLEDKNPMVREAAWERLASAAPRRAVSVLISMLDQENPPYTNKEIRTKLGCVGPTAMDLLLSALQCGGRATRETCASLLAEIDDTTAIEGLAGLIDSEPEIAKQLTTAGWTNFARRFPESCFESIMWSVQHDRWFSPDRASALLKTLERKRVGLLISALEWESPAVKQTCARELGGSSDSRAVEPLLRLLGDKSVDRSIVAESLVQLAAYEPVSAAYYMADDELKHQILDGIGRCDDRVWAAAFRTHRELYVSLSFEKHFKLVITRNGGCAYRSRNGGLWDRSDPRLREALSELTQFVETNASDFSENQLGRLLELPATYIRAEGGTCAAPVYYDEPVNSSLVRQIARQELIRRAPDPSSQVRES